MKFIPRHNQVIGRMVMKRMLTSIVRPDETKGTTKFVLIDAVGPGAAAAGLKVGDVVVPSSMSHVVLDGGVSFRPLVEEANVALIVTDVSLDELLVQSDGGSQYVAFSDPMAAKSLGDVSQQESEAA